MFIYSGEKISILYDPGMFPAILREKGHHDFLRNGGGKITDYLIYLNLKFNFICSFNSTTRR